MDISIANERSVVVILKLFLDPHGRAKKSTTYLPASAHSDLLPMYSRCGQFETK